MIVISVNNPSANDNDRENERISRLAFLFANAFCLPFCLPRKVAGSLLSLEIESGRSVT